MNTYSITLRGTEVHKEESILDTVFIQNLINTIEYIMWETGETCLYDITVNFNSLEILVDFDFDDNDDMIAAFEFDNKIHIVNRDNINDFIKSHF